MKLAHAIDRDLFSAEKKIIKFHWKNFDIFNIFAQNIDCRHRLELPRRSSSNDYTISMFWIKNKKNKMLLWTLTSLN